MSVRAGIRVWPRKIAEPMKVGDRFGALVVLEFIGPRRSCYRVRCMCDCGNETIVWSSRLRKNRKHGTCRPCVDKARRKPDAMRLYADKQGVPWITVAQHRIDREIG